MLHRPSAFYTSENLPDHHALHQAPTGCVAVPFQWDVSVYPNYELACRCCYDDCPFRSIPQHSITNDTLSIPLQTGLLARCETVYYRGLDSPAPRYRPLISLTPPQALIIGEMGGAPRNPAPRNHLLVWIVKPSGCHCTDAFGGTNIVECRPPLWSTFPFSNIGKCRECFVAMRPQGRGPGVGKRL